MQRCPSNLHFNAARGSCDIPKEAHCVPFKRACELEVSFVAEGPTDGLVKCDCGGTCTKPHPYRCDAYYHCDAVSYFLHPPPPLPLLLHAFLQSAPALQVNPYTCGFKRLDRF